MTEAEDSQEKTTLAVIFDFDGVIADTNVLHLKAWDLAYESLTKARVERLSRFSGMRTETIASILAKESEKTARPFRSADIRAMKQKLLNSGDLSCEPIPGVLEFISKVISRNLPWGVASNSNREFVRGLLVRLTIDAPVVVTAEDVLKAKPAPDLFWACANKLGISVDRRKNVRVFEDSEHGIKAAVSAGMQPFGIATDVAPETLKSAGALAVFKDFLSVNILDDAD